MSRNAEPRAEPTRTGGARRARPTTRVPYGRQAAVRTKSQAGQEGPAPRRVDPYTPGRFLTEREGNRPFIVDLVEGISVREVLDESTGISNRVVIELAPARPAAATDLKAHASTAAPTRPARLVRLPNGPRGALLPCRSTRIPVDREWRPGACRRTCWARIPARVVAKTRDPINGRPAAPRWPSCFEGPQAQGTFRDHQRGRRPGSSSARDYKDPSGAIRGPCRTEEGKDPVELPGSPRASTSASRRGRLTSSGAIC